MSNKSRSHCDQLIRKEVDLYQTQLLIIILIIMVSSADAAAGRRDELGKSRVGIEELNCESRTSSNEEKWRNCSTLALDYSNATRVDSPKGAQIVLTSIRKNCSDVCTERMPQHIAIYCWNNCREFFQHCLIEPCLRTTSTRGISTASSLSSSRPSTHLDNQLINPGSMISSVLIYENTSVKTPPDVNVQGHQLATLIAVPLAGLALLLSVISLCVCFILNRTSSNSSSPLLRNIRSLCCRGSSGTTTTRKGRIVCEETRLNMNLDTPDGADEENVTAQLTPSA